MGDRPRSDLPAAPTDHFDGRRFIYYGRKQAPCRQRDLWRWLLTRQLTLSPWRPAPQEAPGRPAERCQAATITWIGHATALIQVDGLNVLTDPVFGDTVSPIPGLGPRRAHPPGIAYADLPPIDVVLISHAHYDHLEADTIRAMARDHAPRFVAGRGLHDWLIARGAPRVTTLDWWQSCNAAGLRVTATPAQHWSRRGLFDRNRTLWCGYVLEAAGQRLYFAGDTGYDPALFSAIAGRWPAIDCALLPIGAYEPRRFMQPQHMNPSEAVNAFRKLQAASAIGIHFGTFRLTDEAREQPAEDLAAALSEEEAARFIVPRFGRAIIPTERVEPR